MNHTEQNCTFFICQIYMKHAKCNQNITLIYVLVAFNYPCTSCAAENKVKHSALCVLLLFLDP